MFSSGINTLATYFNTDTSVQIKNKYGLFDIITINNLLANIDNVVEFIEAIKAVLSTNGVTIIESAYLGNMLKNNMFDGYRLYTKLNDVVEVVAAGLFYDENKCINRRGYLLTKLKKLAVIHLYFTREKQYLPDFPQSKT